MSTIQAFQKITPFLSFKHEAEDAAKYYTRIFKHAKIRTTTYYPENTHMPTGSVMTVVFELEGMDFIALNGGPDAGFNPSISFTVNCKDQEEIDFYWNALTADGGEESVCGWLTDKYGISWQIVPDKIEEWLCDSNTKKAAALMQEVMKMKKLNYPILEQCFKKA